LSEFLLEVSQGERHIRMWREAVVLAIGASVGNSGLSRRPPAIAALLAAVRRVGSFYSMRRKSLTAADKFGSGMRVTGYGWGRCRGVRPTLP
jgi:hypothetical protein